MATTNHMGITLVEQSQSQKEITVNQALTRIDALLNTGAKSKNTNTPPGSPVTGDLYIVGAAPTGAWAGQAGKLAYFDQIWRFIAPNEGITLWVNDENLIYTYDGASWLASVNGETNTASNLGAGTGVFASKVGSDLRFKSLIAGSNVSLSNTANDVTVNANLDPTLNALAAYNTNGLLTQTAADTFAGRSLSAPASGITITNANGVSGNPTFALANDLSAVEGLAGNGIAVRTATDTWATRTITAGAGINVAAGDGVAGNPVVTLIAAISDLNGTGIISPTDGELLAYQGGLWRNHQGVRVLFYSTQSATSYTLASTDAGKVIYFTGSSAITFTLPNNLLVGFNCRVVQAGTGQITFSPAAGATRRNRQSNTKSAGQWAECWLQVITNSSGSAAEYLLSGDTAA